MLENELYSERGDLLSKNKQLITKKRKISNKKNKNKLVIFCFTSVLFVSVLVVIIFRLTQKPMPVINYNQSNDPEYRDTIIEGDILDSSGEYITSAGKKGESSYCHLPYEYGFLVGYDLQDIGSFGLKKHYYDYLVNYTYDNKGASLKLTTNNDVQKFCYDLLGDNEGSITVIENDTGKIIALASRAEIPLDINNITEESLEKYNSYTDFWMTHGVSEYYAPGSTFKMITTAAALENGLGDKVVIDEGYYVIEGETITNFNSTVYGELDLKSAFEVSSNSYFMQLGIDIGAQKLEETANKFLIGEQILLDFALVNSYINIDENSQIETAVTAFGQGKTQMTPIHLAMIAQSIENNSVMMKPYIVDEIILGDEVIQKTEPEILTTTVEPDVSAQIKELMIGTAVKTHDVGREIGMKTGTCELPDGTNQIYIIAFTPKYSIAFAHNETNEVSHSLTQPFKELVEFLENFQY